MKHNITCLLSLCVLLCSLGTVSTHAQTWTASAPSNGGTYYLYNVEYKGLVYGSNQWDTQASWTREGGIPITLIDDGSGCFYISTSPTYTDNYLSIEYGNVYVDKSSSVRHAWMFESVDGLDNAYFIRKKGETKYLVANASTSISYSESKPNSASGYWKLVTPAALKANLANATNANPIDATWAITNFNFGKYVSTEAWGNVGVDGEDASESDLGRNQCAEIWNGNGDVYQTLTNMPNGVYLLKCQGYFRMGDNENNANTAAKARSSGNEVIKGYYYINNNQSELKSIFDYSTATKYNRRANGSSGYNINGTMYYAPENRKHAAYLFRSGEYMNEPVRAVVTDGTLRIGVKVQDCVSGNNDWAVFDNFSLTYLGFDLSELINSAKEEWTAKYSPIVNQAVDRSGYDDVIAAADNISTNEELTAYNAIVWQAVCDILKNPANAGIQFDITSLLENPSFESNTSGWTINGSLNTDFTYGVAEFWNQSTASITQTLDNMPAGNYTLKAQGFYSSTSWRTSSNYYKQGTDVVKAHLKLGKSSALVCNIYDQSRYKPAYISADDCGGSNQKLTPSVKHSANEAFKNGQYWNIVTTTTSSEGDISLGMTISGGLSNNWLCFDNFKLYYGATSIDVDLTEGLPNEDTHAANVYTGITLNGGNYNKICLPFDLDAAQTASTFTNAYTLAGVSSDGVGQLVPATHIDAGKAYFVTTNTTKQLNVSNVLIRVAQPDSIPVIWEGAATIGKYDGYTFDINLSNGYNISSYEVVDYQNMNFSVNLENWCVRRFLNEVDYGDNGNVSSKIRAFNVGYPVPLDQPHSVFIPSPQSAYPLIVTVSVNSNYSNSETFSTRKYHFDAGTTLCEVPNLVPQTTYYYKIESGGMIVSKGQFQTEGRMRMIKADTGFNIRDMGGWLNIDGNRLRYGKVFRGGELNYGHTMNDADLQELRALGIGAEIDWRNYGECPDVAPTTSVLGGEYIFLDHSYENMSFDYDVNKAHTKTAFEFMIKQLRAGKSIYFHCRIGADRTGSYAMLIGGLCGMTADQLCKDFELTTYSEAGTREWNSKDLPFESNLNYIKSLPGNTLQKKFFYYMNTIVGIDTQDLLDFITIMVDGENSIMSDSPSFILTDGMYLQKLSNITAICTSGSTTSGMNAQLNDGETIQYLPMHIDKSTIRFDENVKLETNKEYTLTIPAGAIESDGHMNSNDVTLMFKTPYLFDGEYYIYSDEHDMFLSRSYDYGTRGVLDNFGTPAQFTTRPDNITTILFLDSNKYYGDSPYDGYSGYGFTDMSTYDHIKWNLEPSATGGFLFHLTDVDKYVTLSYDNSNKCYYNSIITNNGTTANTPTPFVVKTLSEHNAILAKKKEANILQAASAAGITASSLGELETILASDYSLIAVDGVIKAADSGNKSYWTHAFINSKGNNDRGGYNVGDYGAEIWQQAAKVSQTITVPHAGFYKLTLNAFIRQGTNENSTSLGKKGYMLSNAYVSINDTYYAQVPDWYSDHASLNNPNNTSEAKSLMDSDKYSMEVYAYIDKKATITITAPGYIDDQWLIFNHWKLMEYVSVVGIGEIYEFDDLQITNTDIVYDLSGRRINHTPVNAQLQKGLYIVNGKKVLIK